jgi:cytosine/adenosine deaminase-related metal-dependent hydrolase
MRTLVVEDGKVEDVVRDILERGGRVGFGTDASSFAGREDFFDELRLAGLLQRRPSACGATARSRIATGPRSCRQSSSRT